MNAGTDPEEHPLIIKTDQSGTGTSVVGQERQKKIKLQESE